MSCLLLIDFLTIVNPENIQQFLLAGNKITTQTGIGTIIAIAGVAIYSYIKAKMEEEKQVSNSESYHYYLQINNDLA